MTYEAQVLAMSDVKFLIAPRVQVPTPVVPTYQWYDAKAASWIMPASGTGTLLPVGSGLLPAEDGKAYIGNSVKFDTALNGSQDYSVAFIASIDPTLATDKPASLDDTTWAWYRKAYGRSEYGITGTSSTQGGVFLCAYPGLADAIDVYATLANGGAPSWWTEFPAWRRIGVQTVKASDGSSVGAMNSLGQVDLPSTAGGTALPANPMLIVYTRSAAGQARIYVNGSKIYDQNEGASVAPTPGLISVNLRPQPTNYYSTHSIGAVQSVTGWQRVLTSTEIADLHAAAFHPAPPAPTVAVSAVSQTTARVDWSFSSTSSGVPITQCEVNIAPNPGGYPKIVASDVRTLNISGLSAGTQYAVAVRADAEYGNSDWVIKAFTTLASNGGGVIGDPTGSGGGTDPTDPTGANPDGSPTPTDPGSPTNPPGEVSSLGVGSITARTAQLTWGSPDNTGNLTIGSYFITISPSVSGFPVKVSGTTLDKALTGLSPNTDYTVKVRARNAQGAGPVRSTTFKTLVETPVVICLGVNGQKVKCVALPPGTPPNPPITIRRDNRVITVIHEGRVVITYLLSEDEYNLSLSTGGWVGAMNEDGTEYTGTGSSVTLVGERPVGGYQYRLFAADLESGLGLSYPLNRYKHWLASTVSFDADGTLHVDRLPVDSDLASAARVYRGGIPAVISYEDALAIYLAGHGDWVTQVV